MENHADMTKPNPTAGLATVQYRALTPPDLSKIRALLEVVFGPGRFARTAYRVREGTPEISAFCRGAFLSDSLIASLRMTPIAIGGSCPHLLLGPLAVASEFAGQGFGQALIAQSIEQAAAGGIGVVVLIGDMTYYGRLGFAPVPPGQIVFPGPADPMRILARELTPGALTLAKGTITAIKI